MKKTTRWRPDTCGCVLEYDWDDEAPFDPVTNWTAVKSCDAHAGTEHLEQTTVLKENQHKNRIVNELVSEFPQLRRKRFNMETGEVEEEMDPNKLRWSFNDQRELVVSLPTLPEPAKASLKAALEAAHKGKVRIE